MTNLAYAISDTRTMLRRNLRRALRYPSMTISVVGTPLIFLLLFVYVFGRTLGAGIGGPAGGGRYIDYVAPGIFLMTAASALVATSVSICTDMTEGIVSRFRTMAIFRPSMLMGHVVSSMLQAMLATGLVIGVALLIGFRPTAGALSWIEAIAVLAMVTFAFTWLAVALGLVSKTPETASNLPLPLLLLPFLGSGFVPTESMPVGLRWFAEYQPFTPIIETLRSLLMGTPLGHNAVLAVGWCAAIAVAGYVSSVVLFNRGQAR
jgi:ABC-2 type transport system permease protein